VGRANDEGDIYGFGGWAWSDYAAFSVSLISHREAACFRYSANILHLILDRGFCAQMTRLIAIMLLALCCSCGKPAAKDAPRALPDQESNSRQLRNAVDENGAELNRAIAAFEMMKAANDKNVQNLKDLLDVNRRNERVIQDLLSIARKCEPQTGMAQQPF